MGKETIKIVRLCMIAGYGLMVLVLDDLHLGSTADAILIGLVALIWLALVVDLVLLLVRSPNRWSVLRNHLGYPLLLAAPFFIGPDLQWWVLLLILVGYLLELRCFAAGRAFAFSFGLIGFVAIAATMAMVLVERAAEKSRLGDVGEASAWVFSTLLRLPGFRPQQPVTQDGRLLGLVVGVCAVLATSFLTAQLVTWVVGSQSSSNAAEDEAAQAHLAALTAELASLRSCVEELNQRMADPTSSATPSPDPGRDDPKAPPQT